MRKLGRNYNPFRELEGYQLEFFGIGDVKKIEWASINSSRGGILKEPWVIVPKKINRYKDVLKVLDHIKPIIVTDRLERFNLSEDSLKNLKPNLFAYFLGILIGDSSKNLERRQFGMTGRAQLSLTKRHNSNETLGEFVCLCANSLGLKMNRIKDTPKGKMNRYPFFRWSSQSTQLLSWVFNVCLGLEDKQVTTYDPVKINWIIKTPVGFKIWFLQGLADSDGYVDIGVSQVGIITEPNTAIVEEILHSLKIHTTRKYLDRTLGTVMISVKDAFKLPIFNPYVRSYRHERVEKIAKAERIKGHWPKWLVDKVELYLKSGLSETQVIMRILDEFDVFIRRKNVHKRRVKLLKAGEIYIG